MSDSEKKKKQNISSYKRIENNAYKLPVITICFMFYVFRMFCAVSVNLNNNIRTTTHIIFIFIAELHRVSHKYQHRCDNKSIRLLVRQSPMLPWMSCPACSPANSSKHLSLKNQPPQILLLLNILAICNCMGRVYLETK